MTDTKPSFEFRVPAPAPAAAAGPSSSTTSVPVSSAAVPPSHSQGQIQVPILPTLPDPTSLWTHPAPSCLFLLQEARANIRQFRELRKRIVAGSGTGSGNYAFSSGPGGSLPPLPPVPVPIPTTSPHPSAANGHASSSSSTAVTSRPEERPTIPVSLKLSGAGKGKGKGKERAEQFTESLEAFKLDNPTWTAEERYNGRAVLCYGPRNHSAETDQNQNSAESGKKKGREEGTAVWVLLKPDGAVGTIKVFLNVDIKNGVPDIASPGWHTGLSDHLTSLNLSLAEILYRIPHLHSLAQQPCHHCSKYIKIPDGMPCRTGYLAPTKQRRGSKRKSSVLELSEVDPGQGGGEEGGGEGEVKGRWVCWHDTCGEQ